MSKFGEGPAADPTLPHGGCESVRCVVAPIVATSLPLKRLTSIAAEQHSFDPTEGQVIINEQSIFTYVSEVTCYHDIEAANPLAAAEYRKRWLLSAESVLATCRADHRHNPASKFGLSPKTPARKFGVRIW